MKVEAQYEVLGNSAKKTTRPERDDRRLVTLLSCIREDQEPKHFHRPWRDGPLFLHHFPALRAGLLSLSPSGTDAPLCIISQHFVLGFYEAQFVKTQRQKKVS